jgi:hypothetical protein
VGGIKPLKYNIQGGDYGKKVEEKRRNPKKRNLTP